MQGLILNHLWMYSRPLLIRSPIVRTLANPNKNICSDYPKKCRAFRSFSESFVKYNCRCNLKSFEWGKGFIGHFFCLFLELQVNFFFVHQVMFSCVENRAKMVNSKIVLRLQNKNIVFRQLIQIYFLFYFLCLEFIEQVINFLFDCLFLPKIIMIINITSIVLQSMETQMSQLDSMKSYFYMSFFTFYYYFIYIYSRPSLIRRVLGNQIFQTVRTPQIIRIIVIMGYVGVAIDSPNRKCSDQTILIRFFQIIIKKSERFGGDTSIV
eukprot:TRINITY_DN10755_c0_g1_i1.p1 TRINITY_DN10755_c0_g1~~TRINITY_DN10755_c0_g1_i1.p1  ORF type:complete len:266 (+),score=-8.85 TRINITY_DN10755_c0_g1_i1:140-937(+)